MSQQTRYKANIAGNMYTIIGKESKEHMNMVTDLVNEQLSELVHTAPQMTTEEAAILLAINAVSDQLKRQEELMLCKEQLEQQTENLAGLREALNQTQESEHKLRKRVDKVNELEDQARKILEERGEEPEVADHIEAQRIINQQMKEKIEKNQQQTY